MPPALHTRPCTMQHFFSDPGSKFQLYTLCIKFLLRLYSTSNRLTSTSNFKAALLGPVTRGKVLGSICLSLCFGEDDAMFWSEHHLVHALRPWWSFLWFCRSFSLKNIIFLFLFAIKGLWFALKGLRYFAPTQILLIHTLHTTLHSKQSTKEK